MQKIAESYRVLITFIKTLRKSHNFFTSFIRALTPAVESLLKDRRKVIIRKDTMEWILKELIDREIDIGKFDHIEVLNDYYFRDIKKDDIVLDIGAGAGLYSLLAGIKAKKVYSIEPLLSEIFIEHIKGTNNIKLLPFAFGRDNYEVVCKYWGKVKNVYAHDLAYILNNIDSRISVIKCDCEGCEWDGFLGCKDFKNVRFIDMEYHTNSRKDLSILFSHLKKNGFSVEEKVGLPSSFKYIGCLYAKRVGGDYYE